jgi:succinoglycan biosynthesis protein ExoW
MITAAVIIPYFQREPGILRRALRSVATQQLGGRPVHLDVIVVDDQSPHPPEREVQGLDIASGQIRIVKRPNGGPGPARNTGLDHLAPDTSFVAFLDSDDIWSGDHIACALDCLGEDADFFFCDHRPAGSPTGFFETLRKSIGVPTFGQFGLPERHVRRGDGLGVEPLDNGRGYAFVGDQAAQVLARVYYAHTSTAVLRATIARDLRFSTTLKRAAEDTLFFLLAAAKARKVVYSTNPTVERGKGVSVFEGVSWSDPQSLLIGLDNVTCFRLALASPDITTDTRAVLEQRLRYQRLQLANRYQWHVRHKKTLYPDFLKAALAEDPAFVMKLPFMVAGLAMRSARGKPLPPMFS